MKLHFILKKGPLLHYLSHAICFLFLLNLCLMTGIKQPVHCVPTNRFKRKEISLSCDSVLVVKYNTEKIQCLDGLNGLCAVVDCAQQRERIRLVLQ